MRATTAADIAFQPRAGTGIQRGIRMVAATMAPTLGPMPRRVAIAFPTSATRAPEMLDDGGVIARRMVHLADREADSGAMLLREALLRVHDLVGDGVATTAVMVQAIFDACYRSIAAGCNAMRLRHFLESGLELILCHLDGEARSLDDRATLAQVATTVCPDDELADCLVEIFDVVGEHGQIELRSGGTGAPDFDILEGAFWETKTLSRSVFIDQPRRRLDVERPAIFLCDLHITDPSSMVPLLRQAIHSGAGSLIVMVAKLGDECLNLLAANHRPDFPILVVRTPEGPQGRHDEVLDDLAALTGARMFRAAAGDQITQISENDLGRARRGWVDSSHVGVIGPGGDARAWRRHVAQLRAREQARGDVSERSKLSERIGRLEGGSALLWVNGATVAAIDDRKGVAQRSARAIRSAIRDGVLPGGGVALLGCSTVLASHSKRAMDADERAALAALQAGLEAPTRTILVNAGLDPGRTLAQISGAPPGSGWDARTGGIVQMAAAGVLDPALVIRTAVRVAVSTAAQALTIDAVVHPRLPEDVFDRKSRRS